ncbi:MAG TPA: hypothetical protein VIF60_07260 [Burkholderiaceae bacterium]|jgi:hypothetical protein
MGIDTDMAAEDKLTAPWRSLLQNAEKNAAIISNEVINDAVLGKSVTAAISPYFSHADNANFLRDEFAAADKECRETRSKAAGVMRAFGLADDWDPDDLKAADEDLWATFMRVTGHAAATNKKRAEARELERESFDNAIDVIDTCAGIATLRHLGEFRCEGDAFCAAYIAALSIAETLIGKSIKSKGMKVLSDFLQFTVGSKPAYRECDIYAFSKTAFGIGRTMGIENTVALRAALILAIKKNSSTPSQIKPHMEIPDDNSIGNLIDFDS